MDKKEIPLWGKVVGTIVVSPFLFVFACLFALYKSYWFVDVWQWFAVAKFSLPALSIPEAWGLFVLVGFFRNKDIYKDHKINTKMWFANILIGYPIAWCIGNIVYHRFVL